MIKVTYTYSCHFCSETKSETYAISMRKEEMLYPSLPSGWMVIDRQVACSDHVLSVNTRTGTVAKLHTYLDAKNA